MGVGSLFLGFFFRVSFGRSSRAFAVLHLGSLYVSRVPLSDSINSNTRKLRNFSYCQFFVEMLLEVLYLFLSQVVLKRLVMTLASFSGGFWLVGSWI